MDAITAHEVDRLIALFNSDDDFFNACMRSVEGSAFVRDHINDATEDLYNRLKAYELTILRRRHGSFVVPAFSDDAIYNFAHAVAIRAYRNMNLI